MLPSTFGLRPPSTAQPSSKGAPFGHPHNILYPPMTAPFEKEAPMGGYARPMSYQKFSLYSYAWTLSYQIFWSFLRSRDIVAYVLLCADSILSTFLKFGICYVPTYYTKSVWYPLPFPQENYKVLLYALIFFEYIFFVHSEHWLHKLSFFSYAVDVASR